MIWHHIKANGGMGLQEQWVGRALNAPLAQLKKDPEVPRGWQVSLLKPGGISCVVSTMPPQTLEQAQAQCEIDLRSMGWSWGAKASTPSDDATASA